MTYAVSGLIQIDDYNGFINTNTPNVNNIWSTGSGNSGYGQTLLPAVIGNRLILASNWANLLSAISDAADHQGTTIGSYVSSSPTSGTLVSYESNLSGNIDLINAARLNAAAQGSTTPHVAPSVISWSNSLTMTFTVTFASENATRYFFNAGGQLGLSFSHPTGSGINPLISDICSELGTIWLSSPTSGTATLSGTAFNGVTKVGGVDSIRGIANTNNGYYAWTPSSSQCYQQYGDVSYDYYTAGTFLRISAASSGTGVITITCLLDEVPNGSAVSSGTSGTLTVRPPSTTYLTNTWGTPSVSVSISAS